MFRLKVFVAAICFICITRKVESNDDLNFSRRLDDLETRFSNRESEMTSRIDIQRYEIRELKKRHDSERDELLNAIAEQKQEIELLKQASFSKQGKQITRRLLVDGDSDGIGFTAYLDADVDIGNHQVIKFNMEITNDGGGYNPITGIFTCPAAGTYLFTFSFGARDAVQIIANLVVNNANVLDAIVDPAHTQQDAHAGNTALVRLEEGDAVWVESIGSSHVEGSDTLRITAFTGFLVYK